MRFRAPARGWCAGVGAFPAAAWRGGESPAPALLSVGSPLLCGGSPALCAARRGPRAFCPRARASLGAALRPSPSSPLRWAFPVRARPRGPPSAVPGVLPSGLRFRGRAPARFRGCAPPARKRPPPPLAPVARCAPRRGLKRLPPCQWPRPCPLGLCRLPGRACGRVGPVRVCLPARLRWPAPPYSASPPRSWPRGSAPMVHSSPTVSG